MHQSKLLLSVQDQELEKKLSDFAIREDYELNLVSEQKPWLEECVNQLPDLAIVQVDDFCKDQLQRLCDSQMPNRAEIIFVSHGEHNPHIDQAMKTGVSFHLRFPVDVDYLQGLVKNLRAKSTNRGHKSNKTVTSHLDQFGLLLGSSAPMRELYHLVHKAAGSDASVLIIGESGSGKELVANSIHILSERHEKPFMTLNCSAISPELIESELFGHMKGSFTGATSTRCGVFEHADGSSLFLDEITEMPLDQQVKLLRVLESGDFRKVGSEIVQHADVRIVAASNREPVEAINAGRFREDLYFRLAEFPIRVPPLRERGDDIPGLARHFLAYRNAEEGTSVEISRQALQKIQEHHWPGNVRELKHSIERAYILADHTIKAADIILDEGISRSKRADLPTGLSLEEIEKQVILKTLAETDGRKKESAERLGISVKTLYNKLEKYSEESKGK